ncbi:hypothetical protein TrispH2_005888 [Trichoplax sp. H2]|nr:hypothetical protein TrispH2_005888 [Trichoplax sp. H2]|eukprot:RDD42294.1 hypothetical protein TrispH2_005888 [Trichoplax sp. H2]
MQTQVRVESIAKSFVDELSEFGRNIENNIASLNTDSQHSCEAYQRAKDQITSNALELQNKLESLIHQSEQQSFKQMLVSIQKQFETTSKDYQEMDSHFRNYGYSSPKIENKENTTPEDDKEVDTDPSSNQPPLNATPKLEGLSHFALEAIRKQQFDELQSGNVSLSGINKHTNIPKTDTPPLPDFKTPGLNRKKQCLRKDSKLANALNNIDNESSIPKRPRISMLENEEDYDITEQLQSPCMPQLATPGLITKSTTKKKATLATEPAPVVDSVCASFLGHAGVNSPLYSPNRSDKDNLSTLVSEATAAISKLSSEEYQEYSNSVNNPMDLQFLNLTIAKLNSLVIGSEIAGERLVIDKALLCEKVGIDGVKCNRTLLQLYKLKRLRKSSVAGKYLVR